MSKWLLRPPLTFRQILAWAEDHRELTGRWPTKASGDIVGARLETWCAVETALRVGLRGLPGGSSLARLLAEQRGVRNVQGQPPLTEEQLLAWADEHHARTGSWPTRKSGPILHTGGEHWGRLEAALRHGLRGLPGGSSLAQLLTKQRGVRNSKRLPPLSVERILSWADAHFQNTGAWPTRKTGPVVDAPGESWGAVDNALNHGKRGLPGRSTLALLLAEQRDAAHTWVRPNLTVERVLSWAEAFHARTGVWPHVKTGSIPEAPGETWNAVNKALKKGTRGLPGGKTLAQVLAEMRGVRNQINIPRLSLARVVTWADDYFRRTGRWPTASSGPIAHSAGEIPHSAGETWAAVDAALRSGSRGLRRGSSLARLLAHYRRRKNRAALPQLTLKRIMGWADAHHERMGRWPTRASGPVPEAPGERWDLIDNALREGQRGLVGGSSLRRLLARKRGVRNPCALPPLTEEQIRQRAALHFQQTGRWPNLHSGEVAEVPGETWRRVDWALRQGSRGLQGKSSLTKLLASSAHAC